MDIDRSSYLGKLFIANVLNVLLKSIPYKNITFLQIYHKNNTAKNIIKTLYINVILILIIHYTLYLYIIYNPNIKF